MKAAVKFNEAEELMLRGAALTEQAMEQVSGGAGEFNNVPKEEIILALVEVAKLVIQFFEKKPTRTQLMKWLMENVKRTAALIEMYSKVVAKEYEIMTEKERKSYWTTVFTRIF